MKRSFLLIVCISVAMLSACALFKNEKPTNSANQKDDAVPASKWKSLPGVLDFYDEVKKVQADFKLETFANGELASEVSGKYKYSKGESVWQYMGSGGSLQRIVECFVDRAVVKAPVVKKRRHRKKSTEPPFAVVAEHQAKYPCVLQALVHYSGAIKRNRLDHDGKVYIVNGFDDEKRQIQKVTMVKGTVTMVYHFGKIVFTPMEGMKLPWDKPLPPKEPAAVSPKGASSGPPSKPETKV
ncbi:hypothetical protein KKF84_08645, partial [Myxococcota bacterium]|nr:hypothetical protein [Myxococcota bacterium]